MYAMKKITFTKSDDVKLAKNEITFLKQLNHKNIIKYLGYDLIKEEKCIYIFMEWAE